MFTGLIKEQGMVRGFARSGGVYRLEAGSNEISKNAKIGDSIAVNGICLTLVENRRTALVFDVMEETVRRTALSAMKVSDKVNLEDSLRVGSGLYGHFVLGHIDCAGAVKRIDTKIGERILEIEFPVEFSHLVVEKGSVALDGISLTVGEVGRGSFKVHIIPHTAKITNLGSRRERDKVNIEFDIIGKYVARHSS